MVSDNPWIFRIHDIWNDGPEGKAAIVTVVGLAVAAVVGLVLMIVM